jgi:hypothetical protein
MRCSQAWRDLLTERDSQFEKPWKKHCRLVCELSVISIHLSQFSPDFSALSVHGINATALRQRMREVGLKLLISCFACTARQSEFLRRNDLTWRRWKWNYNSENDMTVFQSFLFKFDDITLNFSVLKATVVRLKWMVLHLFSFLFRVRASSYCIFESYYGSDSRPCSGTSTCRSSN